LELPTPSRELAERLMTECGWDGRLRADSYNAMAGSVPQFVYSLEQAADFLEGGLDELAYRSSGFLGVIAPAELLAWVRDALGDEELAQAIGGLINSLDRCSDVERQREEVALIQPLKTLLLARVAQCKQVLGQ
jgi:hypothetical protein